jgi:CheY-like chemotaxis protein
MAKYHVCVHRVTERETTYSVEAESEEEAEELVTEGYYDEVLSDDEMGEMEDIDIIYIKRI